MTGSAPAAPTPSPRRAEPAPEPEPAREPDRDDGPAPAPASAPPEPGPPVAEFVEEELPPGFWDDAPPPPDDPRPGAAEERPVAGRPGARPAGRRLPDDPFEAVRQLFPGRPLMVEASADDPEPGADDEASMPPEALDDDA